MSKVVRKQVDDIDLEAYSQTAKEHPYEESASQLSSGDKSRMLEAGVVLDDTSQRSGTFVQIDHSVVHSHASAEGLEVMASTEALERHPWLSDYWWQAVAADADKFTAHAE